MIRLDTTPLAIAECVVVIEGEEIKKNLIYIVAPTVYVDDFIGELPDLEYIVSMMTQALEIPEDSKMVVMIKNYNTLPKYVTIIKHKNSKYE